MTDIYVSFFADTSPCTGGNFLVFPTWYKYLPGNHSAGACTPQLTSLSDLWLIVAAIIEILLRVAAIVAVTFVIYGSVSYITSQGQPDKTAQARNTVVNALLGLAIAVMAATVVSYLAGHIK